MQTRTTERCAVCFVEDTTVKERRIKSDKSCSNILCKYYI